LKLTLAHKMYQMESWARTPLLPIEIPDARKQCKRRAAKNPTVDRFRSRSSKSVRSSNHRQNADCELRPDCDRPPGCARDATMTMKTIAASPISPASGEPSFDSARPGQSLHKPSSADLSHLEDWARQSGAAASPAPFSGFGGLLTAAKMALDRPLADRRSACALRTAAIVTQSISCVKSRWKEIGQ